ncbi:MAG: hypothetical protein KIH63_004210 [Candidatus Saccharibacteria bacterium]|nr:hypothetical protein [Candidatus Saccharibacteria bacterium]
MHKRNLRRLGLMLLSGMLLATVSFGAVTSAQTSESGSVGLEGIIPTDPPSQGATITVPSNGQTFTALPVTVRGLCPGDLLVKVFKNGIFSGSAQCTNGSYEVVIDLFSGLNDLVARVYDTLDQAGPDSNIVTVRYNDAEFGVIGPKLTITSDFAKKGSNPNEELQWPIIVTGGNGPYALSIDWGDGTPAELISLENPGNLILKHTYTSSGIYRILIKGTDKNGSTAYLQLVGVANGTPGQTNTGEDNIRTVYVVSVLWWPAAVAIPLIVSTFWLGRRHELYVLRKRLEER